MALTHTLKTTFFELLSKDQALFELYEKAGQDGALLYEAETQEVWINPSFQKITGLEASSLDLLTFSGLLHPADLYLWNGLLHGDDRNSSLMLRLKVEQGNWEWFQISQQQNASANQPLLLFFNLLKQSNPEEFPPQYLNASISIPEFDRLLLLEGFVNSNIDAIQVADESGRLVYINKVASRRLEIPQSEVNQYFVKDFEPLFEVAGEWEKHVEEVRRVGKWVGESRNFSVKKRKSVPVEISVTYQKISGKGYLVAVSRDISVRKQREEAYRKENDKLQQILKLTSTGVWEVDVATGLILVDERFEQIRGYENGELSSFDWDKMTKSIHPEDRAMLNLLLNGHLAGDASIFQVEFRVRHKSGNWIWCLSTCKVVQRDERGIAEIVSGTLTDISLLKQMQIELEESITIFRTFAEQIPAYLYMKNDEKIHIYNNPKSAEFLKLSPQEINGKRAIDLFPADVALQLEEQDEQVLKQGVKLTKFIWQYLKNGSEIFLEEYKFPIQLPNGKTVVGGLAFDISETIHLREDLWHTKQQFEKLMASVPGTLYVLKLMADGTFTFPFVSENLRDLVPGLTVEDCQADAMNYFNLLIPEDRSRMISLGKATMENLRPFRQTCMLQLKSGEFRYHRLVSQPEKGEDGSVSWYGILQDVTEEVKLEKEIEMLALVAQKASDLMLICDEKGKVTWGNEASFKVLEQPAATLLGSLPGELLSKGDAKSKDWKSLDLALKARRPFKKILSFQVENGLPYWLEVEATPIYQQEGVFLYSIIICRDVTRLMDKQREFERFLKTTTDQNERLRDFAFITSHNIRSSVANLMGLSDLLIQNPEEKQYVHLMKQVTMKLDTTIRNIADILHVEQRFDPQEMKFINLLEVVNRMVDFCQKEAKMEEKRWEINIASEIQLRVIPAYLESIVYNLFSNALKYGLKDQNSKIILSASRRGEKEIALVVKDDGLGIDLDKFKDRLFKLGSRMHEISTGQGMGLYMIKRQVEAMEGSVHLKSQPNKGAEFTVVFK
ncbi:PAS domain S-box protein [Persicobacter diffluens]|uniref:histidine kinase n=1 Tax=Persicobacter diffluens TaxID=981 RepID=A0AAN4W096_9BACT|nr:hypothetical protein PEDI_33040 [Persicobacter diffluens]